MAFNRNNCVGKEAHVSYLKGKETWECSGEITDWTDNHIVLEDGNELYFISGEQIQEITVSDVQKIKYPSISK